MWTLFLLPIMPLYIPLTPAKIQVLQCLGPLTIVALLGTTALIVIGQPTTVAQAGLNLNSRRRIFWNQVVRVAPYTLLGVPYLRIYVADRQRARLWIPLYHIEEARFEQLVQNVAPPENPIAAFFAARGNAGASGER